MGLVLLVGAVLILHPVQSALALDNAKRQVFSGGGTVAAQSATNRVSGTLGQWAAGRATTTNGDVAGGFWYTVHACDCPYMGDLDANHEINILDVSMIINIAFRDGVMAPGDPFCPIKTRADVNCDGRVDIFDVSFIINAAFRGDDQICKPCGG